MEELLQKVIEDGEWKSLRFTVYNYLEEEEYYQLHLKQNGYENDLNDKRLHHEIYLSDPRKVAPEKRKTVIRHPIRKI